MKRMLIAGLWRSCGAARSVGVIGGAPKCAKTWLGLDIALSVATGTACLDKYVVPEPGSGFDVSCGGRSASRA